MTTKTNRPLTPMTACLRAIEYTALAREMAMLVTATASTTEAIELSKKVLADLDVTAKELTTLLGQTKTSA